MKHIQIILIIFITQYLKKAYKSGNYDLYIYTHTHKYLLRNIIQILGEFFEMAPRVTSISCSPPFKATQRQHGSKRHLRGSTIEKRTASE